MHCLRADQMRELDRTAIENCGVPGVVLMENAGLQVIRLIGAIWGGRFRGRSVVICCGKGNNGGDGYVIARHLANRGAAVTIAATADLDSLSGDAEINARLALTQMNLPCHLVRSERVPAALKCTMESADLLVDALLGTGVKGNVRGPARGLIRAMQSAQTPVLAVDLPSGVDADTGQVSDVTVQARWTVTFALPKIGLVQYPGAAAAGEVWVADIGMPKDLLENVEGAARWVTLERVASWLPDRPSDAHKGTFGRCLVVGGSIGMSGAVQLAGRAALRSGAGLVTLAVPDPIHLAIAASVAECTSVPLPSTAEGTLSREAVDTLVRLGEEVSAVAIGPGASRHPETVQVVHDLLSRIDRPIVLDADGLNACAGKANRLQSVTGPLVITPHPGEAARLLGRSPAWIQADRLSAATELARMSGAVTVLKGAGTVIASPDGSVFLNPTGCSGMATGGSGDVLTGTIVALLGAGLDPLRAAVVGTYVHGVAGEIACRGRGEGLIAGDIVSQLPEAWQYCSDPEPMDDPSLWCVARPLDTELTDEDETMPVVRPVG